MLDLVAEAWAADNGGANIWTDPSVRFLDPFTKSGVFLREITSRLVTGLADQFPDLEKRVDHILTKQVFGIGITHLTSLIARRSVYCSKWADGKYSIARSFTNPAGNIWFEPMEHAWEGGTDWVITTDDVGNEIRKTLNGRCRYCGASQQALDRGPDQESHAYAFIHTDDVKTRLAELFGGHVQFDVIIGNPPYQLDDGGHNNSATPIYHLFVENALALDPRLLVMVTPSRWFAGGRGLDRYRARMLGDKRIRELVDFPKLYDGFPGVKIRGGVSYFVWDRDYEGPCTVQTMWDGKPLGEPVARYLDQYDVLVRRNEAVSILEKVRARNEGTLDAVVSSGKPFGLRTYFHGQSSRRGLTDPVKFFGSQRITWIEREVIPINQDWVDDWKVLMTSVQGTSAAVETKFLSKPIIAGPGTACSETYLVAGRFTSEEAAAFYAAYLRTRFVRFLVSLRKQTQHANRDVYAFVPRLEMDREWTDDQLYTRYDLSADEVGFIESQVAPHDADTPAHE